MVCGCVCSNYHRRYGRLTRNEQFGVPVVGEDEYSDVANADLAVEEAGQEDAYQLLSATSTLTIRVVEEAPLAGIDPTLAERCIEFLFEGWRYREISEVMGCSIGKVSEAVKFVRKVATEWRAEMGI
jgi:DNA-directed RNA polymerase specialized sigma24 family protein